MQMTILFILVGILSASFIFAYCVALSRGKKLINVNASYDLMVKHNREIVEKYQIRFYPDWTVDEAKILRTFLESPTGKNLVYRARAMESYNAIKNATDLFHTQHSAGCTKGFSDAINWLESLAGDQTINSLSAPAPLMQDMTADGQHEEAVPVDFKSS